MAIVPYATSLSRLLIRLTCTGLCLAGLMTGCAGPAPRIVYAQAPPPPAPPTEAFQSVLWRCTSPGYPEEYTSWAALGVYETVAECDRAQQEWMMIWAAQVRAKGMRKRQGDGMLEYPELARWVCLPPVVNPNQWKR
jgi:hypothetical protein